MAESILPCHSRSRRVSAQLKRIIHRKHRRVVNYRLRIYDEERFTDHDIVKLNRIEVSWAVSLRRSKDKVNSFLRWANRKTATMTDEEALAYIRRILPRNLIGNHAYHHWCYSRRFRNFNRRSK